jgi:predicted PurR-regulated permease PerM
MVSLSDGSGYHHGVNVNDAPNSSKSQVTVSTVLTVCLTVLFFVAAVFFIFQTRVAVILTLTAALLSVALNHVVDALEKHKVRRSLAVAFVMFAVILIFAGIGLLLIPTAVSQGRALVEQAPKILQKLRETELYSSLNARFQLDEQLLGLWQPKLGSLQSAAESTLKAIGGVVTVVAATVTVFFLIIFMLIFGGRLVAGVLEQVPPIPRARYQRILQELYRSMGGYLGGLLLICVVNGCVTTSFLAITKVPFFLPLGIMSGLASLIPYVGTAISAVVVSTLSWVTGSFWHGIGTALYYILYGQFEGQLLAPMVYRRTINVNPLVTLLSTLFFVDFAGLTGAVIAVPVAATLQILLREIVVARREKLDLVITEPAPSGAKAEEPALHLRR